MTTPTIRERLKFARKQAGYTQAQASEASGIALGTLKRWEQGVNEPNVEAIIQLADLYNCTTDELLGSKFALAVPVTTYQLPWVGRIAAGTPIDAIYESGNTYDTPEALYRKHRKGFWLTINGNSMNRLFPDGSVVLIDPELEVQNGDVGAILVNGNEATVKRFYKQDSLVELRPESYDADYSSTLIDLRRPDAPSLDVIGKVVHFAAGQDWRA